MIARILAARAEATVFGVMIGALLGAIIMLVSLAGIAARPPLKLLGAKEFHGVSAHDGLLEIEYRFVRQRECNSLASTWLWRWVDGPAVGERKKYYIAFGTSNMTIGEPSPLVQEIIIAGPRPAALTSGNWFLKAKYNDYCSLFSYVFGPSVRVADDIPVLIR